jgi:inosine/xanthosine triphosphate pyrophosphatase family protein
MKSVIAATHNEAKLEAFRRLVGESATVSPLPHDISPGDSELRDALTAAEEGSSINEIASAKAVVWSRALLGELVIASDGGLLIPALGDKWDPTRTRRIAAGGASDLERAELLLARTAHLRGNERRISWQEVVAIARDGELLGLWSAESEPGMLAAELNPNLLAQGRGFWVDTLWICPESHDRRLAELTQVERTRRGDHWSRLEPNVRDFLRMNRYESIRKD